VSLDEEDLKAVREMATAMNGSSARVVRHAVAEFIGRHDKKELLSPRRLGGRTA
jgi:predicted transcriptional regulator